MQLKQLKLAGFKSFVEPTTLVFPGPLTAVVGPNGCGKSNLIDAIRWVMGERSFKQLRGEVAADIIFNGSSGHKPLGQAVVELTLDNSLGRLSGPYAGYQEIAVKRLIRRDGESAYFLNNTRCRRRDIQELFMGTGVGARGYAIISQHKIMEVIEATPEALRVFLEEAAGVSRYKERRRETMQKLQHTRDNLLRVQDIRDTLTTQLMRLETQAKLAKRYKALKEKERFYHADILAIKWRDLKEAERAQSQAMKQQTATHETLKQALESLKTQLSEAEDTKQQAVLTHQHQQSVCDDLKHELTRLEIRLQQTLDEQKQHLEEQQQVKIEFQQAFDQKTKHDLAFKADQVHLKQLESQLQASRQAFDVCQQAWQCAREETKRFQSQWMEMKRQHNEVSQARSLHTERLQHLEAQINQIETRLAHIQKERRLLDIKALQMKFDTLNASQKACLTACELEQAALQERLDKKHHLQDLLAQSEQSLKQQTKRVQALSLEKTALKAALDALLYGMNKTSNLKQWQSCARLLEVISVPDDWRDAFELVLSDTLHAIVLDEVETLLPALSELQGSGWMFVTQSSLNDLQPAPYPRLIDKIQSQVPASYVQLHNIYAASSLKEALQWLPSLLPETSVVTQDGYWFGDGWIKSLDMARQNESGLLKKKQALKLAENALSEAHIQSEASRKAYDVNHAEMQKYEKQVEALHQRVSHARDVLQKHEAECHQSEQSLTYALSRETVLCEEETALKTQLASLQKMQTHTKHTRDMLDKTYETHDSDMCRLAHEKDEKEQAQAQAEARFEEARAALHAKELAYEKAQAHHQTLSSNIQHETRRMDTLESRVKQLHDRALDKQTAEREQRQALSCALERYQTLEAAFHESHQRLDVCDTRCHTLASQHKHSLHELNASDAVLHEQQMKAEALRVRLEGLSEAIRESDTDPGRLLEGLPTDVTLHGRERALSSVREAIKRLGAVNLIAIEEYDEQLQQKNQLDKQYDDLMEAVALIEAAVVKMDKETHERLSDTFDGVNTAFQSLFPKLFGGGYASLQWTCDTLLEAGILIQAQPPGKRNGSIHMLSGGEKALTAVALIFAMFQLNPAPFCMLDEVDAPLDDLNVGRFCNLVKDMAHCVQFLLITHNKLTMELADHLIGVTMREPGVSRLVSVEVERALSMNGSE